MGENPRSWTSEASRVSSQPKTSTDSSSRQWNERIHVLRAASGSEIQRKRVWRAGELEGSGKAFIHDRMLGPPSSNQMRAKRCFRVRVTHDFETRQQALSAVVGSAVRSSHRCPMMRSKISGGRERDMVVFAKNLIGCWVSRCK